MSGRVSANAKRTDLIIIYCDDLKKDCQKAFEKIPTKSKTFTSYLQKDLSITPSVFNDSKRMFYNNAGWINQRYMTDNDHTYETYGCVKESRYLDILKGFKLKDEYRVPLKSDVVDSIEIKIPEKPKSSDCEERFTKALERIADAQESQAVMLEKIFMSLDEIEKHWRPMRAIEKTKPIAKLEKKEEKANG